jgi:hypothetical protein
VAGLDDLTAESTERWARAGRYARGFADNGMGEALRVYYTRYFPTGVILYIGALTLAAPLLSGDEPTDWRLVVQLGVSSGGLLGMIAGLVYNAKRLKPRVEVGRNLSITFPLEKDEQKYVKRVINGQEPAPEDPARLTVARAFAVQTRKNTGTFLLIAPLYICMVANGLTGFPIFWITIAAGFAVGITLMVREFRRAGQFLATTAPSSPS